MAAKILIVEDESGIRDMLAFALRRADFETRTASDVVEASAQLGESLPDLILLDWMLPGASGLEFARRLKKNEATQRVPIIMLTARGEEDDKIRGLETGADDYITKPFSPRELVARINAVLRRVAPAVQDQIINIQGLCLDPVGHRISAHDDMLEMGPTEFKLLHFFMTHIDRVYSRSQLLDHVWGNNVYVEERTVDVHIRRLRKALSKHGHERLVQTVRGSGYRFSARA
ncbi:MAG: phosphate regulon transcriptional regulator PhoB [Gammaproteobacteria bacterium]